jgi:hypothetical protein
MKGFYGGEERGVKEWGVQVCGGRLEEIRKGKMEIGECDEGTIADNGCDCGAVYVGDPSLCSG